MTVTPCLDQAHWLERWDHMQARYLVARQERFDLIVRLLRDVLGAPTRVVDLGCGTGSLMVPILEAFPGATVYGVDLDPALLILARSRLAPFGPRAQIRQADLRSPAWLEALELPLDAAVSATALHWLNSGQVAALYRALSQALRPGGLLLNADHVASGSPAIQSAWEQHRESERAALCDQTADDWDGFWQAFAQAVPPEVMQERARLLGPWQGVEEGLPLAWHLDALRAAGFGSVDCFWRRDCDAVYGGIRR